MPKLSPERWQQAKALFHAALNQPAAERETFLAAACAEDLELRAEVEQLLAQHQTADAFLEASPFAGSDPALVPAGGQGGQAVWSRREDPGALPDLELRHVLRYLVLTLEGGVRHPDVPADGAFRVPN